MPSIQSTARAALALALVSAPVLGQEEDPLVGDRPDFTESAITVTAGRVQVEAGATHTDSGPVESLELGEVLVRIGLTPKLELRVGLPSYARVDDPGVGDPSGFVDSSLGVKIALSAARGWTTALLVGTSLPTGSTELGERHAQPGVVLAAERDLTESISLGTNLGYAYSSDGGVQFGEAFASVAVGVPLGESAGAFFELFGTVPSSSGGPETYFFDSGITRGLGPNFQLDLRVGAGLNSAADDFFVGAGLIWRR